MIRTDLEIVQICPDPPTSKSEHSRQKKYVHFGFCILKIYFLRNFVSTDNTMPLGTRFVSLGTYRTPAHCRAF